MLTELTWLEYGMKIATVWLVLRLQKHLFTCTMSYVQVTVNMNWDVERSDCGLFQDITSALEGLKEQSAKYEA